MEDAQGREPLTGVGTPPGALPVCWPLPTRLLTTVACWNCLPTADDKATKRHSDKATSRFLTIVKSTAGHSTQPASRQLIPKTRGPDLRTAKFIPRNCPRRELRPHTRGHPNIPHPAASATNRAFEAMPLTCSQNRHSDGTLPQARNSIPIPHPPPL